MKYVPGVLLVAVIVGDVLFAVLLWQYFQRRNTLGRLLWEAPRPRFWVTVLWLVLGTWKLAEALYRGPGLDARNPLDHAFEYVFGGSLAIAALILLLLHRGLRVYERGVIHSLLVLPWKDIRSWAWTDDGPPAARELQLWIGSAWRWYLTVRSKSPIRTSAAYDEQLDSLLQRYATTATRT